MARSGRPARSIAPVLPAPQIAAVLASDTNARSHQEENLAPQEDSNKIAAYDRLAAVLNEAEAELAARKSTPDSTRGAVAEATRRHEVTNQGGNS